jgi:prepilin-type N-terminal cleavage/methylation domain-containing protein
VRARLPSRLSCKLSDQSGFTIVEVLVAALVLAVGVAGLIGAFDSARKLTLLSERRTAMAHRAQLELERLQSYPFSQLAMASQPSHSGEKSNPDYYVNYNSPVKCTEVESYGCFAWDTEKTGEEEALIKGGKECISTAEKECGWVAASPTGRKCSEKVGACVWLSESQCTKNETACDGLLEAKVYDFVTWYTDGGTKKEKAAKRLTVVVTGKVPGGNHEPAPVRISTLVTENS